ncbi:glycosyltransferase [Flavobacterium enshiense]|uniref:glycosyltransferase n=1 Tax=Flavobacterium enshiense TaxID=1341165 RepID=UPI00345D5427
MKVLHITTSAKGGAGIAALRLHNALSSNGVSSAYLSANLTLDYTNQQLDDPFFNYKKPSVLKRLLTKIKILFWPSPAQKAKTTLVKLVPQLQCEITSLPFSSFELHKHPLVLEADVINLHWISGIADYSSFFENCQKPIVWTLHDMNPFQGIFHYKEDEVRNKNSAGNFDRAIKEIKEKSIQNIKTGVTVAPSAWLLREAIQHDFFPQSLRISIPNAIDLAVFKVQDATALRQELGIGEDEFTLLFVSDTLENPRKGFDLLLEALHLLEHLPITIVTIGKGKAEGTKLKNVALGNIDSVERMATVYALADAFVLPSREDNLPNVMLEAFACGTPVISFNHGGMQEHVREHLTGVLAKEMNGKSLAEAIEKLYANRSEYPREAIRKYAEDNFSFAKQAKAYTALYKELMK